MTFFFLQNCLPWDIFKLLTLCLTFYSLLREDFAHQIGNLEIVQTGLFWETFGLELTPPPSRLSKKDPKNNLIWSAKSSLGYRIYIIYILYHFIFLYFLLFRILIFSLISHSYISSYFAFLYFMQ